MTGDKFELYSSLCPGGYEVSGNSRTGMKCQCLEQTEGRIVNCEQDQDSIIVQASSPSNIFMLSLLLQVLFKRFNCVV